MKKIVLTFNPTDTYDYKLKTILLRLMDIYSNATLNNTKDNMRLNLGLDYDGLDNIVDINFYEMKSKGVGLNIVSKHNKYNIGEYKNKISINFIVNRIRIISELEKNPTAIQTPGVYRTPTIRKKKITSQYVGLNLNTEAKNNSIFDKRDIISKAISERYQLPDTNFHYSFSPVKDIKVYFEYNSVKHNGYCRTRCILESETIRKKYGRGRAKRTHKGMVVETNNGYFDIEKLFFYIDNIIRDKLEQAKKFKIEKKQSELERMILKGKVGIPTLFMNSQNCFVIESQNSDYGSNGYIQIRRDKDNLYSVRASMMDATILNEEDMIKLVKCYNEIRILKKK